jgi:hypothetical protein
MRRPILLASLITAAAIASPGCRSEPRADPSNAALTAEQNRQTTLLEINRVLDDFHDAAAVADLDRYFGNLTAHAVFLGTDAWERWPRDDFREYAAPHFLGESAWAYTPRNRSIALSASGETAWFDETVVNEKYGSLRGSGVLELCGDGVWRIAQYNLGFTIPNEIAGEVVEMIKSNSGGAAR